MKVKRWFYAVITGKTNSIEHDLVVAKLFGRVLILWNMFIPVFNTTTLHLAMNKHLLFCAAAGAACFGLFRPPAGS